MVELLEAASAASERMEEQRKKLGRSTGQEERESLIESVYASLAIEDPTVTEDEVREVLSGRRPT